MQYKLGACHLQTLDAAFGSFVADATSLLQNAIAEW
jgi:hypothetical protein